MADGPFFFNEAERQTVTGFTREELLFVWQTFEDRDDSDETAARAIQSCLSSLLLYRHKQDDRWGEFLSAPRSDLEVVYEKWTRFRGERSKRKRG